MLGQRACEQLPASELRLPARASKLALARDYARAAAAACGFAEDACYELSVAVNEAVTNAIRHGRPDAQGTIRVSVQADERALTVAVRDFGTFSAGRAAGGPDGAASAVEDGGRGFAVMAALMDAVQLCVAPGSTTVRLCKALP
ncbi:MAG TPA: ATP-binding protein [Solirubrobacteraceae bacterium]|jgi:anti-sigma regulatory factor (Ser/Thr protein kinase)|nr:ATP-binding protein [Solirubrobacteraceae bacterium]